MISSWRWSPASSACADRDPFDEFENIAFEALTTGQLYTWMKERFSAAD